MKKRRVALVLAGGGARGVAHIGAIEELERQGFEISVKGDRVMEAMKELVPDVQIERMPVPFAAVAADLLTGDEVVLDSGGLYDAIRASISIPSVFRPVHRDGRVLVDGGTVNPLPLNRVRREEGDLLVAVDVSARFGADSVRRANASLNYYKVLIASSQIMQQRITQLMCRLYKPDIMVGLPADSYGMFEFYRSEAGRAATRAALERLETDGENGMVFAESEEKIATARF